MLILVNKAVGNRQLSLPRSLSICSYMSQQDRNLFPFYANVVLCVRTMFTYLCFDQKLERYYTCGDQEPLWGQNACPHEFVGIFEAQCGFSVRVTVRLWLRLDIHF